MKANNEKGNLHNLFLFPEGETEAPGAASGKATKAKIPSSAKRAPKVKADAVNDKGTPAPSLNGESNPKTQAAETTPKAKADKKKQVDIRPPCFAVHDDFCLVNGRETCPGVWRYDVKETKEGTVLVREWVATPIHVRAITRNEQGENYGFLLEFLDDDKKWKTWSMPRRMLSGSGEDVRKALLDRGARIAPGKGGLLNRYFMKQFPKRRVTSTSRVGWTDDGETFVFPRECISSLRGKEAIFQAEMLAEADYPKKGTLEGWRRNIGQLCEGNPVLTMAVSAALAGPLLLKTDKSEGAGIHFLGDSSKGKSTALQVAASVWGNHEFMQSWNSTANGLEGIAAARNDTCLIIDEISEGNPYELGKIAYMIANGRGKSRANRIGEAKGIRRWRIVALSTGEKTLSSMLESVKIDANSGQNVRLLNIPSTGFSYGAFDCLHGFASGRELADALKQARHHDYSLVGYAFIENLLKRRSPNLPSRLKDITDELKPLVNTTIEGRAADTMALFILAGELGIEYGLLPWKPGAAMEAGKILFELWRDNQTGDGTEDKQILKNVKDFIDRHGDSRFQFRGTQPDKDFVTIRDRAGWFEMNDDNERVYLFHSSGLKEAGGGFELKRVAQALDRAGWVTKKGKGRLNLSYDFRDFKGRLYAIKPESNLD
ncbi:Protein of unknown function DUF927 [Nitrosococcus oceani ATCC 19707]|uniref:DUF927 domain-containing protein n=2 Tax=Nitrosococcus oceani TaxID=1229 RepID=Q3J8Z4_NITOC|nr:DUF927 domain-containing protein [Nitrosococcus oceani]ABA58702.1 Protein of unknown function DUF927 [Nitrosococcus oceani ATCC 19707]EDZ67153.1 conserved domain protein [Nitrosococcus oceani AFC27]KFI18779.1 hypothetical protein IB75_11965 [Nitrosococcus oceani C-27]GEM19206.1 hypothetical protein NONS58_05850 [Nitrosococcus oceani]